MPTPAEIQQFVEIRLQTFDPSLDLSPGSPAQTSIVAPIVSRFGTDPLATDVTSFIRAVVSQAFPDLGVNSGGTVEDLFNAIALIFEPFRRTAEEIRIAQSPQNAALMSDEQAEALADIHFASRKQGKRVRTGVRLYFAAPTNARVSVENRCSTKKGLGFFPITGYSISATQMLFSRQNTLYFLDIQVDAEQEGAEYNVRAGEIDEIDGVPSVVKVANLTDASDGDDRQSNVELLSGLPNQVSERSLATTRGVIARVADAFQQDIRTLQVVGAGDEGMDRDILKAHGEGTLFIAGSCMAFGDWLVMNAILYKDDGAGGTVRLEVGDQVRSHAAEDLTASLTGVTDVVEANVLAIYPFSDVDPRCLLILDKQITEDSTAQVGRFATFKPAKITISEVPGGVANSDTVPDGGVHLGGHVDVFARPVGDTEATAEVQVSDEAPLTIITDLEVVGDPSDTMLPSNLVKSDEKNFVDIGVEAFKDVLEIESGDFVDSYPILGVGAGGGAPDDSHLRLGHLFSSVPPVGTKVRARITRNPRVNLVTPKIRKYPFAGASDTNLRLLVSSPVFRVGVDLTTYGVTVGDTIEILSGEAKNKYLIKGFDSVLGGFGPIVDKKAPISATDVPFVVYTAGKGISRPMVRVRKVDVIDSSGQSTGVSVPYGLPVDARPVTSLAGAGVAETIYDRDLLLFPDGVGLLSGVTPNPIGVNPGSKEDARYSQHLVSFDADNDVIVQMSVDAANDVVKLEYLLRAWLWSGRNDQVLAYTTRRDPNFLSDSSGNARTSAIAEAKIGDTIRILEGPNAGAYVLRDLHVFDFWKKTGTGHEKVAVARIDPPLKTNPVASALRFVNWASTQMGGPAAITAANMLKLFEYSTLRGDSSDFFENILLPRVVSGLTLVGMSGVTTDIARTIIMSAGQVSYQAGPSARGQLRVSFIEPAAVEFYSGNDPTEFASGISDRRLRLDPSIPPAQVFPEVSGWLRNIETPETDSLFVYARTAPTLIDAGVRPGDLLEFRRAINDLPARRQMTSSWVCLTRSGTPNVRLCLPKSAEIGNFIAPEEGQVVYIETGPDAGEYSIIKILSTPNWSSATPDVLVQLDRPLTFTSSQTYPLSFSAGIAPQMVTSGNVFPTTTLTGKLLSLEKSSDSGSTWSDAGTHTFASEYSTLAAIVAELEADSSFMTDLAVRAFGDELIVRLRTPGPNYRLRLKANHDAGSAAGAAGKLHFGETIVSTVRSGRRGATCQSGGKRIYGSLFSTAGAAAGKYVHLYAGKGTDIVGTTEDFDSDDRPFLGSFKITEIGTETDGIYMGLPYCTLERNANFPELTVEDVALLWGITDAPLSAVSDTTGGGKELSTQYIRFRMYDEVVERAEVDAYPWDEYHPLQADSTRQIALKSGEPTIVSSGVNYGFRVPYRVLRPGVFKVSATAMQAQREGGLYYVDVPVVGYGPDDTMNIGRDEPFEIAGRHRIEGYTLAVENDVHTYSDREEISILLPPRILPAGFSPGSGKDVTLPSKSAQVRYDWAPILADLQQFLVSPLDRPQAANVLARHFLPAYVFVEGRYVGGSTPDIVAADIIKYILTLPPHSPRIQLDDVVAAIKRRQPARVVLPITVLAVVHGADRKLATLRSDDFIGLGTIPNFKGTFSQVAFVPGPNVAGQTPRPDGEQILLTRL